MTDFVRPGRAFQQKWNGIPWRWVILFSLLSNASVLFVMKFGDHLWPDGLAVQAQYFFWLASGVNVAGLLILGMRFWPVLLINAFPAAWFTRQPLDLCLIGGIANLVEALSAAWIIRRLGAFEGGFDRLRATGALLGASLLAPALNSITALLNCVKGRVPWSEFTMAIASWNLSTGAAMIVVAPLLVTLYQRDWRIRGRWWEFGGLLTAAAIVCVLAFRAVFEGAATNFAFLAFPVAVYAAMRFGTGEMAVVLGVVLVAIYAAVTQYAYALPEARMVEVLWFIQAFCWVLAATGLLVAALEAERRRATEATVAEREQRLEGALREERSRLETLRYQLNPHFLFNALNSIYATLPGKGDEVPGRMLMQISSFLRATLAQHDEQTFQLHDELKTLQQYLDIEKTRFGDDLHVTINASQEAKRCRIPVLLLQPLVENAIVHGFESSKGGFELQINAEVEAGRLSLEVANTGRWKPGRAEGIGLENTRKRLALMFGESASLQIDSVEGRVRVKLNLPALQGKEAQG